MQGVVDLMDAGQCSQVGIQRKIYFHRKTQCFKPNLKADTRVQEGDTIIAPTQTYDLNPTYCRKQSI